MFAVVKSNFPITAHVACLLQLIVCPWLRKSILKTGILLDNRKKSEMQPENMFSGPVSLKVFILLAKVICQGNLV